MKIEQENLSIWKLKTDDEEKHGCYNERSLNN